MQYKKSDFVFFEFELSQVQDTEQGEVVEISTGFVNISGRYLSDRCFPLSLKQIRISHLFSQISKKIHEYKTGLNYPDIHRKLVEIWVEASQNENNEDALQESIKKVQEFKNAIDCSIRLQKEIDIMGVQLFR